MEYVVLVDTKNNELWTMEKLEAHEKWLLHRAFSIFLFNDDGELLIQQRDNWKYHCGWLWTNTVCSHQRESEGNIDAAVRRLQEEMWIQMQQNELEEVWAEVYRAEFENGLTEHEYDCIIVGKYNGEWDMNPDEVMNACWMSLDSIKQDIANFPEKYTPWFKIIMNKSYF